MLLHSNNRSVPGTRLPLFWRVFAANAGVLMVVAVLLLVTPVTVHAPIRLVEALIIVAPPKTLGELRKHYHKEVEGRIEAEIAKDLTGHPVDRIEAVLQNYQETNG